MNTREFQSCVDRFVDVLSATTGLKDLTGYFFVLRRNDPLSVEIRVTSAEVESEVIAAAVSGSIIGKAVMSAFQHVGFVQGVASSRKVSDHAMVMTFNFHTLRLN